MKHLLFIGTLNQPTSYFEGANGDGLSVHLFDDETLTAERLASAPQIVNPTFLSPTPDGSLVYANSEIEGWYEGLVTALSFDRKTGRLDHLNMQPSLGATTAHNAISRDGRHLFVVNYAMGAGGPDQALVAFERRADGSLAPGRISAAQSGTGPNASRQERSHPHSVTEIAPNLLLVADLGTDRLTVYSLESGQLEKISETATRPGAGPRHAALHQSGRFVFVINELDSTVASYRIGAGGKSLKEIGVYPTVPDQAAAANHASDLQISPDGRFLYGANRGHDSIAVFAVDAETGRLSPMGQVPCGGRTPRNLAIAPQGGHLLCANQDSDVVSIFARDAETGSLVDSGKTIRIGTPMCLRFARA
ncbi:lactonase family protein [Rhizobium sp. Rhizsp82]|uniref:lactonase family protein n=1 Tax=Rhizobium sp. Rhizsp82 TaxID=3243057 RepID=UPI0039B53731